MRLETTTKEVSFFRHYRGVEQPDRTQVMKYAPMRKSIYSLGPLREALVASNRRYLEFLSSIDDPHLGVDKLHKLTRTVQEGDRSYRGFNFFDEEHQQLLETIARGEFNISGLRNKSLRERLAHKTSGQISRLLKRLRVHGLIKKAARAYKYYLTPLGKQVIALGLKLKQLVIIPELAQPAAS